MLKIILIVLVLNTLLFSESIPSEEEKKEFLIAKSTKSYEEAKSFAKDISKKLEVKLDFRGLKYHKSNFLTESKEVCEEHWGEGEYPCYLPRGRDDGTYISIEHTNVYGELSNGYYIVVVATGKKLSETLKEVKKVVKDAYVKKVIIYLGCLH